MRYCVSHKPFNWLCALQRNPKEQKAYLIRLNSHSVAHLVALSADVCMFLGKNAIVENNDTPKPACAEAA